MYLTFHTQRRGITDVFAFSIILFTARRSARNRFPGIPSLLDIILRDATRYFMLIFLYQFLPQVALFTTEVGGMRCVARVVDRVVLTVWIYAG